MEKTLTSYLESKLGSSWKDFFNVDDYFYLLGDTEEERDIVNELTHLLHK